MEHSVPINQERTYWNLLKGLSRDMKLRLIKRLSESLLDTTTVITGDIPQKSNQNTKAFPTISKNRKISRKVMNMAIGPLPEGMDWDKETEKMWEELAR